MTSRIGPQKNLCNSEDARPQGQLRLPTLALGAMLAAFGSSPVLGGGADVSSDEIYSDGVTLSTWDGAPLDINDDGNTDLAVAANRHHIAGRSRYYLGNGDGTFSNAVRLTEGASSEIVAATLTDDVFLDLVQGRRDLTDLLHVGDGAGGLLPDPRDITADEFRVLDLAIGDLNGDGFLDIVTGNGRLGGSRAEAPQPNRYYLNDGMGNFTGADVSADADDTRSVAIADIDGDGHPDVIVGNDETTAGSNLIYPNQSASGTMGFDTGVGFGPEDDQTAKILISDLNGDGLPDIVVLNHANPPASPGTNRFYLNQSSAGTVQMSAAANVSDDADNSSGGVLADFDGDGDLDLAVANLISSAEGTSARNRLYLNQFVETGSVSFSAGMDISADEHMSRAIAAGDLNGDGFIDLVVGNQDGVSGVPGRDRRYLNNGTSDPFTNVAPVIDDQAVTLETGAETGIEILLEHVNVTDPDNVFPRDFTLTVQPGNNYTVAENTVTPDAGFSGNLPVSIIVSDGSDDSEPFDLTVTVTEEPGTQPSFTSTPIETATEGVEYVYEITATDPNGDPLVITAPVLPDWLALTDNGDGTATLKGTPTADHLGDHDVRLEVSDGTEIGVQTFVITASDAASDNTAPTFTSTPVTEGTAGTNYTYDVTASDEDGDSLTMTAPTLPNWLTFEDHGDGTATLAGTPEDGDVGEHDVTLEVSDGTDTAMQAFTISVTAASSGNTAPEFSSTATTEATEGSAYSYNITTTDADGDSLEITAPTLPGWLSLTDNGDGTGTLSGTPAAADVGEHNVSLQVSDGIDTATQDFTVTVSSDPGPAPTPPPPPSSSGGGGGSLGFLAFLALLTAAARRNIKPRRHS